MLSSTWRTTSSSRTSGWETSGSPHEIAVSVRKMTVLDFSLSTPPIRYYIKTWFIEVLCVIFWWCCCHWELSLSPLLIWVLNSVFTTSFWSVVLVSIMFWCPLPAASVILCLCSILNSLENTKFKFSKRFLLFVGAVDGRFLIARSSGRSLRPPSARGSQFSSLARWRSCMRKL